MKFKLFLIVLAFLLVNITNPTFAQIDDKVVILHTNSGKLVIEFFSEDAPSHVTNFINLTQNGFYDRTIFHRVIDGFMIQGGDPLTKPGVYETVTQWGTGDPGYKIKAEFNNIKHNRGIISMARSADPDSAGSQFFVVHKDSNFLDCRYTVFGRLITQESYETLDKIANLTTAANDIPFDWGKGEILKAEVVKRSEIPDLLELGNPERVIQSNETTTVNGLEAIVSVVNGAAVTPTGEIKIKYKEATIAGPGKFYKVSYASTEDEFENNLQKFENSLKSFKILSKPNDDFSDYGGGCLIATATFGSELAPQVQKLRETRDNILMNTESGKTFLSSFNQLYYSFSPTIADWERQNPIFKETVKVVITPLLTSLSILNYVDIDSEAEMIGYGVGVFFFIVEFFFAGPAIIIHKLKRTEI